MMSSQRTHEGMLVLDHHRRYCIWEPERSTFQTITLTSGCSLEVWLNREWVSGCVEGDGQDYWLFVKAEGKFLLSEGMRVRYREPW
jgi:uncharacterized protein YqjF (DUF2071 family)